MILVTIRKSGRLAAVLCGRIFRCFLKSNGTLVLTTNNDSNINDDTSNDKEVTAVSRYYILNRHYSVYIYIHI